MTLVLASDCERRKISVLPLGGPLITDIDFSHAAAVKHIVLSTFVDLESALRPFAHALAVTMAVEGRVDGLF